MNQAHGCVLVWHKGQSKKFIPLGPKTNTSSFMTVPKTFNYQAFEAPLPAMHWHLTFNSMSNMMLYSEGIIDSITQNPLLPMMTST
jgi:hypothetical protein